MEKTKWVVYYLEEDHELLLHQILGVCSTKEAAESFKEDKAVAQFIKLHPGYWASKYPTEAKQFIGIEEVLEYE